MSTEDRELSERMARVETKIDHLKDDLDNSMKNIYRALGTHTQALEKRVSSLESNQTWLWRTVIGGLIAAIIGFFVKG